MTGNEPAVLYSTTKQTILLGLNWCYSQSMQGNGNDCLHSASGNSGEKYVVRSRLKSFTK